MDREEKPGTPWFSTAKPKVEGFEQPDCPHGFLRFEMSHNRTDSSYRCTECDKHFIARTDEEDAEE